jgi:hypothetical protein
MYVGEYGSFPPGGAQEVLSKSLLEGLLAKAKLAKGSHHLARVAVRIANSVVAKLL